MTVFGEELNSHESDYSSLIPLGRWVLQIDFKASQKVSNLFRVLKYSHNISKQEHKHKDSWVYSLPHEIITLYLELQTGQF